MIRARRFACFCAAVALAATCALAWSCDAPDEESCSGCGPPNFCRVTCSIDADGNGECECFAFCDPPPSQCADDAGCGCLVDHAIPPESAPDYTCAGDVNAGLTLESKACTP